MTRDCELLTPQRCCLLVVDPQEKLLAVVHEAQRVIRNTSLLIRCARVLGMSILASTQYKKGLGPLVPELAELLADIAVVDKTYFSALADLRIKQMATHLPATVDTFILAGAETHICIYQTALGAMKLGLKPWIVADAVSSRNPHHHELALSRMQALGMAVGPAEMLIYELLRQAGTPAFKAMLPFLK